MFLVFWVVLVCFVPFFCVGWTCVFWVWYNVAMLRTSYSHKGAGFLYYTIQEGPPTRFQVESWVDGPWEGDSWVRKLHEAPVRLPKWITVA